jgi:hypothetical protein
MNISLNETCWKYDSFFEIRISVFMILFLETSLRISAMLLPMGFSVFAFSYCKRMLLGLLFCTFCLGKHYRGLTRRYWILGFGWPESPLKWYCPRKIPFLYLYIWLIESHSTLRQSACTKFRAVYLCIDNFEYWSFSQEIQHFISGCGFKGITLHFAAVHEEFPKLSLSFRFFRWYFIRISKPTWSVRNFTGRDIYAKKIRCDKFVTKLQAK